MNECEKKGMNEERGTPQTPPLIVTKPCYLWSLEYFGDTCASSYLVCRVKVLLNRISGLAFRPEI